MVWVSTLARTPGDVYAKQLDETLYPVEYRSIIRTVVEELQKQGENPDDFFARVHMPPIESIVRVSLWHKDAFSLWHYRDSGNPGGKCRDMYFDQRSTTIEEVQFWK